jgi:hypothetical protein
MNNELTKYGILTQPLGKNYGGIIQNFALHYVIKELGHIPVTINRVNDNNFLRTRLSLLKQSFYHFLKSKKGKTILMPKHLQRLALKELNDFIESHIQITEVIDNTKKLKLHFENNIYKGIIVGSDQTWRPKYSPNIYNFFLDFIQNDNNIKKISYASSFGTDVWEYDTIQTKKCNDLIRHFDAISVREETGVRLCKDYLNVESEKVLDPTLLLDKEVYINLFKVKEKERGGLFKYVLDKNTEKSEFIERIANEKGIKLFTNQPLKSINEYSNEKNINNYKYPSLESWLKSFYEADFIITDSFHGTVFSIIFNKPFISIINSKRGASRFESLLSELGLESRMIYDVNDFNFEKLDEKINYDLVNQRLEILKEHSVRFLKNNL